MRHSAPVRVHGAVRRGVRRGAGRRSGTSGASLRKISRLPTSTRDVPGSIPARSSRPTHDDTLVRDVRSNQLRAAAATTSTTSPAPRRFAKTPSVGATTTACTSARASSAARCARVRLGFNPRSGAASGGDAAGDAERGGFENLTRFSARSPSGRFWARRARRSACWCRRPWRSPPSWSAASSTGTRCAWGRAAAPPGSRTRCSGGEARRQLHGGEIESDAVFREPLKNTLHRRRRMKPRG